MAKHSYPGKETVLRQVLPNGVTVLAYENFASRSIVVEGLIRAGALAESRRRAGLAGFTASLLMRGTRFRDHDQIFEALEAAGADLHITSGMHGTTFLAVGLAEDAEMLLELAAEAVRWPDFPPKHVERLRGQILTGLQIRANDTRYQASLAFAELAYPDHPYGRSTSGYPDSIAGISRDDILAFHGTAYRPAGAIIVVVGPLRAEAAVARVSAVFGDWQSPTQSALPLVPMAAPPDRLLERFVPLAGKTQTDIMMGLPGPSRCQPDYLDASLMNTIFGVFGLSGRVGQTVREELGLAYEVYSHLDGGLGPGPWYVYAGVDPADVRPAIAAIQREIQKMQESPVSAAELADSQAFRRGSLPVSLETNSGLAQVVMDMEFYGLGLDYLERFADLIQGISADRIQAAAQKYLSAEALAIGMAGPARDARG